MGLALLRTFFFFLWLWPTVSKTRRMLEIRERRLGIAGPEDEKSDSEKTDSEKSETPDERDNTDRRKPG